MILTQLDLEKVAQKVNFPQATQFAQTEIGISPERFNAVNVVFPANELIFTMMNLMMAVTIEDQTIIRHRS